MKKLMTASILPAALLSMSLLVACQNTARGVEEDTERNASAAGEKARETGDRLADGVQDATRTAGASLDAAAQTMQIKTALVDAENIDAADINVDTDGEARTVTLKGHVRTPQQKIDAERIAREKAPQYRVVNLIEVGR